MEISKPKSYLWSSVTQNTLSKCYYISYRQLHRFRKMARFIMITITLLLAISAFIRAQFKGLLQSEAYLTVWGIWGGTLYFILVEKVLHTPDNSKLWKFTYILGEVTFCLEFLIVPFFWIVLFPVIMQTEDFTWSFLISNLFLHLIPGLLIYYETTVNDFVFPKEHFIVLAAVSVIYSFNNFIWTKYAYQIYPLITYEDTLSYILIAISFAVSFVGFWVGRRLHNKKLEIRSQLDTNDQA